MLGLTEGFVKFGGGTSRRHRKIPREKGIDHILHVDAKYYTQVFPKSHRANTVNNTQRRNINSYTVKNLKQVKFNEDLKDKCMSDDEPCISAIRKNMKRPKKYKSIPSRVKTALEPENIDNNNKNFLISPKILKITKYLDKFTAAKVDEF